MVNIVTPKVFSLIPAASVAPSVTDYVVGVTAGSLDRRYSLAQVQAGGHGVITPFQFGAIADGGSHPLSTVYSSLATAQAVYPFATSLTQEIDFCACKAASNAAFGPDGAEHALANRNLNLPLRITGGRYYFGNDTWLIRSLGSGVIYGDGMQASVLTGNATVLAFDGLWYSNLQDFGVTCLTNSATVAMSLDGDLPGHPYTTFGVQGTQLQNLFIDGGGSSYCLALLFFSAGAAQGSEMLYVNVHLFNSNLASYYQAGFNALDNQFWGGDVQFFQKHGIYSNNSPISVFGTSFESTNAYQQYLNGGYDIVYNASGVRGAGFITGCRSENMTFHYNGGSNFSRVQSCALNVALNIWFANAQYGPATTLGAAIIVQGTNGRRGQVFVATVPGTSGGTQPVWPLTGTVTDGTITWTALSFNAIFIQPGNGSVDNFTIANTFNGGNINASTGIRQVTSGLVTANYTLGTNEFIEDVLLVDATSGPITITIPGDWQNPITVRKVDTTANAVTVTNALRGFDTGSTTDVLPGGARTTRTYLEGAGAGGSIAYNIISTSTV